MCKRPPSLVARRVRRRRSLLTTQRTVPVGTPVTYLGTDYLQIDLATRLIYNVTSSSDLVNYYMQLGDDVIGMS